MFNCLKQRLLISKISVNCKENNRNRNRNP